MLAFYLNDSDHHHYRHEFIIINIIISSAQTNSCKERDNWHTQNRATCSGNYSAKQNSTKRRLQLV